MQITFSFPLIFCALLSKRVLLCRLNGWVDAVGGVRRLPGCVRTISVMPGLSTPATEGNRITPHPNPHRVTHSSPLALPACSCLIILFTPALP